MPFIDTSPVGGGGRDEDRMSDQCPKVDIDILNLKAGRELTL